MDPARIKGIPCFALVMCAAHLLRPLYCKILDPPLVLCSTIKCLKMKQIIKSLQFHMVMSKLRTKNIVTFENGTRWERENTASTNNDLGTLPRLQDLLIEQTTEWLDRCEIRSGIAKWWSRMIPRSEKNLLSVTFSKCNKNVQPRLTFINTKKKKKKTHIRIGILKCRTGTRKAARCIL